MMLQNRSKHAKRFEKLVQDFSFDLQTSICQLVRFQVRNRRGGRQNAQGRLDLARHLDAS